ncbi:Murein DD-endopeptidase MepM and murein hydrolase activator NlpD, contain LysM domain [Persephonella hydrogeniphila]|uniref:Murein DD-endopeptidase MepM and murein hydrolase activator NlpD, contain LysM domain n=1 Tax=Persephonella hydrogeniphila TaxID=198703 RepID=A0A285NEL2_9AQUI|nr:M23 family metallopeptidase [Persephonella hydrogeniphila]SNZ07890.1 Murein DD-endopeptidase MepM and murein hydrolase activator NlpD, contain LysM domain [Persephonella hydrogeniphila]
MRKSNLMKYYIIGLTLISFTALFLSLNSSGDVKQLKQKLSQKDEIITQLKKQIQEKDKKIQELSQEKEALVEKLKIIEEKIKKANKTLKRKGIRIRLPQGGRFIPAEEGKKLQLYADSLDKNIDKLLKVMADVPIGVPLYGRITSRFGYRRDPFNGRRAFHSGIDLRARYKQPVFATANGYVEFAGWSSGYGKLVIIRHKYGYKTYYGHLAKIRVKKGRWVKAGTVIGYAGSTGRSTGVHLHYEIRRYGKLVNPLRLLYLNRTNSF